MITNPDTAAVYTWQRLGSGGSWTDSTTGNSATDTLYSSGIYRVQVDKNTCISVSDSIKYVKPVTTSIGTDSNLVRYYPNPVTTTLTIDSLHQSAGWLTLEIINASNGTRTSMISIENQLQVTVDVASLPVGIYLAVLRRKTGDPVIIKFLKL